MRRWANTGDTSDMSSHANEALCELEGRVDMALCGKCNEEEVALLFLLLQHILDFRW